MNRRTVAMVWIGLAVGYAALPSALAAAASASVMLNGMTFTFSGGSYVKTDGGLTVNIGVPRLQAPPGTHPDYFGASLTHVPGSFSDAVVSFTKDGKRYSVIHVTGQASDSGASFSGTLLQGGGAVKGSFTC